MSVLGIDPGKSGGLALVSSDGEAIRVEKMPGTERDVLDLAREMAWVADRAVLESVASMPTDGRRAAFTFGWNYGGLRMALHAAGVRWDTVPASKWKRTMRCLAPKGSSKTKAKNIDKARAQQLFPGIKITHATADALLIAQYGVTTGAA